jgi:aspartyl protease family protein
MAVGAGACIAAEVGLAGVIGSKALLTVDGAVPRAFAVGPVVPGVRLLSVDSEGAVLEIDGRKRRLLPGAEGSVGAASGAAPVEGVDRGDSVILTADGQGHFLTLGRINGGTVRFLVDTGATRVAIGPSQARQLGLDPTKGQLGYAQTANGAIRVSRLKLDTVEIGGIVLHNVDAEIGAADMPFVLLGMSFLNRTEMHRDGGTLHLRRRY